MSLQGSADNKAVLRGKLNRLYELRGYSAYEVALINGFKGTEEEWLNSLTAYDGVYKVINGVRRKASALGGYVCDLASDLSGLSADVSGLSADAQKSNCRLNYAYANGNLRIYCGRDSALREVSISVQNTVSKYEIYAFSGYTFTRNSIYSTTSADKTFVGLWIDGVRVDEKKYEGMTSGVFDALSDADLRYRHLMWLYTVTENGYTVNVCTRLSADVLQIYESIPETLTIANPLVKTCAKSGGAAITPLVPVGDKFEVFVPTSTGNRYMIEKIDDLGQTVVKTFYFN